MMTRKAILVIPRRMKSSIEEILSLLDTADYEPVSILPVRSEFYITKSKLVELEYMAGQEDADVVIFYGNPKPSVISRIRKATRLDVLDRTLLILEIFDLHAGSKEAKLQIELARLKHLVPIIREMVRRKRMGELPGFMGPGMYDVEKYYRHIKSRISRLRRELKREQSRRIIMRRSREGLPHVAIVGYASAGKTSIFNRLTGESKPVGPEYFTTLQTKHKAVVIGNHKIVFIDTVGFIRDVPPEIIEAFHATLEETTYSDVILFVVDSSEDYDSVIGKIDAGLDTLARIEADMHPIVIALNKTDIAREQVVKRLVEELSSDFYTEDYDIRGVIPVSSVTGYNIGKLVETIHRILEEEKGVDTLVEKDIYTEIGSPA